MNPWRLQSWMGHKRIDETMIYVHVAEHHRREIPEPILEAAQREADPDRRVLAMLAARGGVNVPIFERPALESRAPGGAKRAQN